MPSSDLGRELEHGCLAIQGPPGSGKTRAAARLAVALIRDGWTVGITANSHAVITNLLDEVGLQADTGRRALPGLPEEPWGPLLQPPFGHATGRATTRWQPISRTGLTSSPERPGCSPGRSSIRASTT